LLLFKRPRPPVGFAASVSGADQDVRAALARGAVPTFDEKLWKKHKGVFIEAQHGKCAYCEQSSMNHPGAVEHYAPKSEIHELIADGQEQAPTASVAGRKTRQICATGYWWLAYDWSNWLFACERCNTAWKRCLYPVREKARKLPPRRGLRETSLLLSPFGRVDPSRHLQFTELGQIVAYEDSDRGEATIRTCGLDRESLRRAREGFAEDTYRHVRVLQLSINADNHLRASDAVKNLLSLGANRRPHAGMVRSIVRAELGCDWSHLPTLYKQFVAAMRKRA
jgi:hypothetical protein